ncbi:G-protein alpha subunit-domain-containing protein [Mycena rosella]|uniref:G-protein alpha subunit-domain-containing protein n=1 Tax=Mycena rosella TaxID=1033263 RepID=A0AAD7D521_MYCRO|nr:G-protein alpha subunit-domain-containing protein [Mycena rosella]
MSKPGEGLFLAEYGRRMVAESSVWLQRDSVYPLRWASHQPRLQDCLCCAWAERVILLGTLASPCPPISSFLPLPRPRISLYLFESMINLCWYLRTSIILLNKIDVFRRKLPKIPLGRYFPEYAGGNDLQKAAKYILSKFMHESLTKLTRSVTQATNTKNIRLLFAAVKETILQNALKDSGIL